MTNVDIPTVKSSPLVPPIMVLRERLQAREAEIRAALPPDISYAQFVRAVMTAASINPEILRRPRFGSRGASCRDGLLGRRRDHGSTARARIPMYEGLLVASSVGAIQMDQKPDRLRNRVFTPL
jgi:hypothetical protein